ncbi:MAG: hypothetical protein J5I87_00035, partial [Nitrosomonas nitrosa]|nr:hypothetical protein [Nitrosomonas nitrosa]
MNLIEHVICPGCQCKNLQADTVFEESNGLNGTLHCTQCNQHLEVREGIIHALPHEMSSGQKANRLFYDSLTGMENNHLARRTVSRNHYNKIAVVDKSLALGQRKE